MMVIWHSLIIAKNYADIVVVSLFINPSQFDEIRILITIQEMKIKILIFVLKICRYCFYSIKRNYVLKMNVWIYEDELSNLICGQYRPNHFKGVCTIVLKLFNIS